MLRETTIFNLETSNFVRWHPWAGLYLGNKTFMGVGGQDFGDKLNNRAKTGKCPIFQDFEVKFPQFVPEW